MTLKSVKWNNSASYRSTLLTLWLPFARKQRERGRGREKELEGRGNSIFDTKRSREKMDEKVRERWERGRARRKDVDPVRGALYDWQLASAPNLVLCLCILYPFSPQFHFLYYYPSCPLSLLSLIHLASLAPYFSLHHPIFLHILYFCSFSTFHTYHPISPSP